MSIRFITILFLMAASCSTPPKLTGTWISDDQDAISLNDDGSGLIESHGIGILDDRKIKQTKNKLKFHSSDWRYRHLYFRWIKKDGDTIIIAPLTKQADSFFNNRRYIRFTTQDHFYDQTNYFTTIIYHLGPCFGICDDRYLQLDYSGNLKVTNNGSPRDSSRPKGSFYGKVSYQYLYELRVILQHSRLKTLKWPNPRKIQWHDTGISDLVILQNDKHYYFAQDGRSIPIVSYPLISYLSKLFEYPTLRKVDTTYKYDIPWHRQ